MQIRTLPLVKGIATNALPWLSKVQLRGAMASHDSARYSYSIWLRHLLTAHNNGLSPRPNVVAELGPGKSLGLGYCALLSGVKKYHAFDLVKLVDEDESELVFRSIVDLFKNRSRIPNDAEFPNLQPKLNSYEFPHHLLSEEQLSGVSNVSHVESIVNAIRNPRTCERNGIEMNYFAPWNNPEIIQNETVDMLCSQFVLEHVDDLFGTYSAMFRWLKPGGVMSHFIDFRSHFMTKDWNGHWTCSDRLWNLMRGKRPYMLNREPHSAHLRLMEQRGFEVVCDITVKEPSGISRNSLSARYKNQLDSDDLVISGALIQAVKKRI